MISTLPPSLLAYISNTSPSGYCGAESSILQMGKYKAANKATPIMIVVILIHPGNLCDFIYCCFNIKKIQRSLFFFRRQQNGIDHMYHTIGCRNRGNDVCRIIKCRFTIFHINSYIISVHHPKYLPVVKTFRFHGR